MNKYNVSSRWLVTIIFQFLIMIIAISFMELRIISGLLAGLVCMLVSSIVLMAVFFSKKLFTPITGAIIFDISFALYIMKLVKNYYDLPYEAMVLVLICMFMWKVITICSPGYKLRDDINDIQLVKEDTFSVKIILLILFIIALCFTVFEWRMAGGIPIFREDQETFRFSVSYLSLIHI